MKILIINCFFFFNFISVIKKTSHNTNPSGKMYRILTSLFDYSPPSVWKWILKNFERRQSQGEYTLFWRPPSSVIEFHHDSALLESFHDVGDSLHGEVSIIRHHPYEYDMNVIIAGQIGLIFCNHVLQLNTRACAFGLQPRCEGKWWVLFLCFYCLKTIFYFSRFLPGM